MIQGMVNKAQQQQGYQQQQCQQRQRRAEEKIKVDFIPPAKKTVPDSEGDFIDYEEVK